MVFLYRIWSWFTARNWMRATLDECQNGFGGACAAHLRSMWFTDRGQLVFENPDVPKILEAGCSSGTDSLCKFLFGLIETQRSPELELKLMTKACSAGDLQACGEVKATQSR